MISPIAWYCLCNALHPSRYINLQNHLLTYSNISDLPAVRILTVKCELSEFTVYYSSCGLEYSFYN